VCGRRVERVTLVRVVGRSVGSLGLIACGLLICVSLSMVPPSDNTCGRMIPRVFVDVGYTLLVKGWKDRHIKEASWLGCSV